MNLHYVSMSPLVSQEANAIHVMRMAAAFARLGHDVTLHAAFGAGSDQQVFDYYGTAPNFLLRRHPQDPHPIDRRLAGLANRRRRRGVRGAAKLLLDHRTVRRVLTAERPDLVYTRHTVMLPSIPTDIPLILESHAPPSDWSGRIFERRAVHRESLKRLVLISEALRQLYHGSYPFVADRMLVAHDAADDPDPPPVRTPSRSDLEVGYVGHLYPGKGGELIAQVAALVPDATFRLVGGTSGDIERTRALTTTENVHFHGHHPPSRLHQFYADFDVTLAPYQEQVNVSGGNKDIAPFMSPLKIFEYLAWGKPVICSDLPVLREVLVHDRNAVLVPPDDPAAWAAAIRRLGEDPRYARRLAEQGRADFLARHTWDARARAVLDGVTIP